MIVQPQPQPLHYITRPKETPTTMFQSPSCTKLWQPLGASALAPPTHTSPHSSRSRSRGSRPTHTPNPRRVSSRRTQAVLQPQPPRSPTPPAPQPPFDLGTRVVPHTPFPYLISSERERRVTFKAKAHDAQDRKKRDGSETDQVHERHDFLGKERETERDRDVEVTLLAPRPHLPERIPYLLPVWGRGLVSSTKHCVYTDDSPIVLCALHADSGSVTWSGVCSARDQRLTLIRHARL